MSYEYEWRTNTTGLFNKNDKIIGTGSSISFNSGILGKNFLYLTITSSNGFVINIMREVMVLKCGPIHSKVISKDNQSNDVKINTTDGNTSIKALIESNFVYFQISDVNGRVIFRKKFIDNIGLSFEESLELQSGIYFLTVWNDNIVSSQKFIVNKL